MASSSLFLETKRYVALVTGSSRGIGKAIAEEFRTLGVHVLAPERSELDLDSPTSISRFGERYKDQGIDILVNNAGINVLSAIDQISSDDWNRMIQVNLTAPFKLIQCFAPGMKKKNWGRILNISSIFGVVTKENRLAYSTTKSGLNGLTRTTSVELGSYGILANSLCPGYVDTELTRKNNSSVEIATIEKKIPLGRMAKTEELSKLAVFLCSEHNSYLTGQSILIDGGFTCL
ncbi:MAG: SDR family oxidoreductase [Bdellovibrionia bacterium]